MHFAKTLKHQRSYNYINNINIVRHKESYKPNKVLHNPHRSVSILMQPWQHQQNSQVKMPKLTQNQ